MAQPDQASTDLPEYDALRRRLKNQFQQQNQEGQDALQRRYAANGMVGSGAYGKEEDQRAAQATRDEADATGQVDFAQANEVQRRKEVADTRAFQTSERQGAQQFASGERVAGQEFNKDLFDRDQAFKTMAFNEDTKQKWAAFDLASNEFTESKDANKINAQIALAQADQSPQDFNKFISQYNQLKTGQTPPQPTNPGYYVDAMGRKRDNRTGAIIG